MKGTKKMEQETRSLFGHILARSRLKSRKDFMTSVNHLTSLQKFVRCNKWHWRSRGQVALKHGRPTSGGTVGSFRPANCCQLIPPNSFLYGFPDPSSFAATKLTPLLINDPLDHGYASCCQEMYTRTHVRCVLPMSQVVG